VKLLFDENLSPRLPGLLADIYPNSKHVQDCGLSKSSDADVWEYARLHGFTIVSKDSDFQERSILSGGPPKIIWLRILNCRSAEVAEVRRNARVLIQQFIEIDEESCLILNRTT
jgi:predicted nuclease of predicted toxin-antitoxin system